MEERRHLPPLNDQDIGRIATAVAAKTKEAFHIGEEKHYNDHQRLDRLLDAYESARSTLWRTFLALVIVGAILLAGIGATKGVK